MKYIFTIIIVFQFVFGIAYGQDYRSDVKTPKDSTVPAWIISSEYPDSMKIYWDSIIAVDYPNIEILTTNGIYSTTKKFNCHAYAWHVSEGGSNRWIGYYQVNTDEYVYWQDGSYIEVTGTVPYPGKVSYTDDDHSAITTSNSGWFISKWGNKVLARHAWNDCPYTSTNLKYYKLSYPTISSTTSGALCNNVQRTYSSDIVETNFTYNWSAPSPLSEVSGDGTSSYTVEGTSQNGQGTVSLTVTTPSGATATASRNIWVGKPQVYSLGDHLVDINTGMGMYDFCYGTHNEVEAVHPAGDAHITTWDWRVTGGTVYPYGSQYKYATIYPNSYSNFMVEIRAINTCGVWTDWARMYTNVVDCYSYYMVFSPNPTIGETTLSIESTSKEEVFDETAEWELEVYSPTQTLKEKKTKLKGKDYIIQTAGWKEGVYVVRVKYKDEVLTGKLVVKE